MAAVSLVLSLSRSIAMYINLSKKKEKSWKNKIRHILTVNDRRYAVHTHDMSGFYSITTRDYTIYPNHWNESFLHTFFLCGHSKRPWHELSEPCATMSSLDFYYVSSSPSSCVLLLRPHRSHSDIHINKNINGIRWWRFGFFFYRNHNYFDSIVVLEKPASR